MLHPRDRAAALRPGLRHHSTTYPGSLFLAAALRSSPALVCRCSQHWHRLVVVRLAWACCHEKGAAAMQCLPCNASCIHVLNTLRWHILTAFRSFALACLLCADSPTHAGGVARCHAVRVVRRICPRLQPGTRVGSGRDCMRGGGGIGRPVPKRRKSAMPVACHLP